MTKEELIREVHERTGKKFTLKDLSVILDEFLGVMSDSLKKGEEVQLANFGTFSVAGKTLKPAIRHTAKSSKN